MIFSVSALRSPAFISVSVSLRLSCIHIFHDFRHGGTETRKRCGQSYLPVSLCRCGFPAHRIFLPKAESASSTPSSAVRLASSMTGFTSVNSNESMRPESAIISMARCASR